jgi:hypothetical protein
MDYLVSVFFGIFLILTMGYIAIYSVAVAIASKKLSKEIAKAHEKAVTKTKEWIHKAKKTKEKIPHPSPHPNPNPTKPFGDSALLPDSAPSTPSHASTLSHTSTLSHASTLSHTSTPLPDSAPSPSELKSAQEKIHSASESITKSLLKKKKNNIHIDKSSHQDQWTTSKEDYDMTMGFLISSSIVSIIVFAVLLLWLVLLHWMPTEVFCKSSNSSSASCTRWFLSEDQTFGFMKGLQFYIFIAAIVGIILQALMLSFFIKEDQTIQSIAAMIIQEQDKEIHVPILERIRNVSQSLNRSVQIQHYLELLEIFSWTTLGLVCIPFFLLGIAMFFP